ncbi:MAG TPA: Mo-dependent nitrogenase C-terminal domain-containing protein [Coleofasciculaceae cyanobacterium]
MNVSEYTTLNLTVSSWVSIYQGTVLSNPTASQKPFKPKKTVDLLQPVRKWINQFELTSPKMAHLLCQLIPAQCPFERDIQLFGRTLFHIPPMCKLNPLYEEVVALRFRALCYLADKCGEDISSYC